MNAKVLPLGVPYPKDAKLDTVTTVERTGYWPQGYKQVRFNPDDLLGRKGIRVYQKMRLDEQVKAVMNFTRDAITARGFSFKYEDDSPLSQTQREERVKVFTKILRKMNGSFIDSLNVIATGRDFGFSMTEKVYTDVEIDGKTYVGLNMLLGRDPSTFKFHTDEWGILRETYQE